MIILFRLTPVSSDTQHTRHLQNFPLVDHPALPKASRLIVFPMVFLKEISIDGNLHHVFLHSGGAEYSRHRTGPDHYTTVFAEGTASHPHFFLSHNDYSIPKDKKRFSHRHISTGLSGNEVYRIMTMDQIRDGSETTLPVQIGKMGYETVRQIWDGSNIEK